MDSTNMPNSNFISVDWGTSNLRIRWVNWTSGKVEKLHRGTRGIKAVHSDWQKSSESRLPFFLNYLLDEIKKSKIPVGPNAPIVISGMASSSIGIKELPYAPLPFLLEGTGLGVEKIHYPAFDSTIYLISGVCTESDVMRGEETQLIGLRDEISSHNHNVVIMPGTHSKHVEIRDGRVIDFSTYMTGELFDVICKHTVLSNSIIKPTQLETDWPAFKAGVLAAKEGQLLQHLFKLRANDLLHHQTKAQNFHHLSGLLLGEELKHLKNFSGACFLAGEEPLSTLYHTAAEILEFNLTLIPSAMVQNAAINGQVFLYNSAILQ